ncbi:MAG: class I SAM-dependent methyltransferase [Thiobacillus sp.]|nr:class I SAM-dependent methyltransferase [Thiobacillus sp.]
MQIDNTFQKIADFWSQRYRSEQFIWGQEPSPCAEDALPHFRAWGVRRLLILGCGYGRDARYFASEGIDVTAVDFAREGLDLAQSWLNDQHGLSLRLELDHILTLNLPDAGFDAVFSHRTLHLLMSVQGLEQAFDQIHRVLKPGGHACISMRSPGDPSRTGSTQVEGGAAELSFRPGHKVLYLPQDQVRTLLEKRFGVLEMTEMMERESMAKDYDVTLHYAIVERPG